MSTKKQAKPVEGEVIEAAEAPTNAIVVSEGGESALTPKQTEKKLGTIASAIRKEFGKGLDAQFAIGNLLITARELIPSDKLFGQWVEAQDFGFSRRTAGYLREAAEREDEVREFIATRHEHAGQDIGPSWAVQLLNKGDDDRQPAERVKAVQELLGDEPVSAADKAFERFQSAANALDVSQLTEDELVALAGIIKSLAAAYTSEKERR